jgi:hypothetical protein
MRFHRIMRLCKPRFAVAALLCSTSSFADELTGSDVLICHGLSAARCEIETGACEAKTPWALNLPDFVKLDIRGKHVTSTPARGEAQQTRFSMIERANGFIVLQGNDGERPFSWLITEATGEGTLTLSSPRAGLTVFTVCAPFEKL